MIRHDTAVHVYGYDLTSEGELGKGTIRRLKKAQLVNEDYECPIVISAELSPYHEYVIFKELMAEWLYQNGVEYDDVWFLSAKTFNTEGETEAFGELKCSYKAHLSSWWHLPRIRRLERRYEKHAIEVQWIPVWDFAGPIVLFREFAKYSAMFFPTTLQNRCKKAWEMCFGRTSY